MSSSKILANKTTAFNTKLFVSRLEVSKTTIMNIEYIILITDYSVLRLLFYSSLSHKIKFWDYLSKTESLHQIVYNNITNTILECTVVWCSVDNWQPLTYGIYLNEELKISEQQWKMTSISRSSTYQKILHWLPN